MEKSSVFISTSKKFEPINAPFSSRKLQIKQRNVSNAKDILPVETNHTPTVEI